MYKFQQINIATQISIFFIIISYLFPFCSIIEQKSLIEIFLKIALAVAEN